MISVSHWRARGRIHKINGYDIFIIDEGGNGDPHQETIVMLHGFPTASRDWSRVWPLLGGISSKPRRLIAMDLLGLGLSQKPVRHKYKIMEQADIVETLIRQRGLNQFHILAHDYGDTVAQELLARQNERKGVGQWLSCCLLNGGLFPETHKPLLSQKILNSPFGFIFNALINKKIFVQSLSETFGSYTQPTIKEMNSFWELVNYNSRLVDFHRLIKYINDREKYRVRWCSALKDTHIPIAIINGSADPISGSHMVDYYLQIIGKPAYLARLENIGHYPQIEVPQETASHYLAFLSRIPISGY